MIVHPAIKNNALAISKAGLAFTFGIAASAIMLVSINAYLEPAKPRTVCAIEVTMNDGNVYRPSVADTCKEAWQGFKFESLAGRDWRQVLAVAIDE